jgi:hypothetical protein|tara:strand:+ start:1415 stop:1663 length:249 start_codon:yes stop_codon:yes gene_type:complete
MIKYLLGSVFGGFIALISAYFKGKSVANKQTESERIKEKNEILEEKIIKHETNNKITKQINKEVDDYSDVDNLVDSLLYKED